MTCSSAILPRFSGYQKKRHFIKKAFDNFAVNKKSCKFASEIKKTLTFMKKKLLLVWAMTVTGLSPMTAQEMTTEDLGIFNHLGGAVGVGTTGISVELAAPLTSYVAVRGGVNIMPAFKYNDDFRLNYKLDGTAQRVVDEQGKVLPDKVSIQGKPSMTTGHLLFDIFPFRSSSFHLTAGAYFGGENVVNVYNKDDGALSMVSEVNKALIAAGIADPATHNNMIGVSLGNYFLTPDRNGNVKADIKVSAFRPYLGFGFGRPVPTKSRFTCNFDMGVQFWGKPKVMVEGNELSESDTDGKDGGVMKVISKIAVWPVISIRLVGRIL